MKNTLFCLMLAWAGLAAASELTDANALFDKKAYPQALQLYTKLGNAGNVEAQRRVGEMYFYGEAGEVDEAKAEPWLRKAAAKGEKTAVALLDLIAQRAAHRADIEYWTSKYDGADLRSGKFRCPAPRFPQISKLAEEVARVLDSLEAWQQCYNGFVDNLNANSPLTKRIPPEIAKMMNAKETAQAETHLAEVRDGVIEDARVNSKLVLAEFGVWRSATAAYVAEHNQIIKNLPSEERMRDIEARKNNYAPTK